jgi:hypothetical protein
VDMPMLASFVHLVNTQEHLSWPRSLLSAYTDIVDPS